MGKANRERRRMKEKARKRTSSGGGGASFFTGSGGPGGFAPPPSQRDRALDHLRDAVTATEYQDAAAVARAVARLAAPEAPGWRHAVEQALLECLTSVLRSLWGHGWQPADLLRIATRRFKAPHGQLLRSVIAAELAGYAPSTIDPRWQDQLAEGDVRRWWPANETAVQACAARHPGSWTDFLARAVELLHGLNVLPVLELLGPVPGTATPATARPRTAVDERVLARVRALLAKAESTNYPAEAETFTAGAQALMARHSIDHALLMATGQAPSDEPTGRRIGIDNPYEAPKATLLDAVASANRCRAVWSKELGFVTVVGFPTDLDTVEMLFTSLLVQASAALAREGTRNDGAGRSRTRSFRQSFLLSYAARIRERLDETTREQTAAVEAEAGDGRLLPVLAARTAAVDEAIEAMFPSLVPTSVGTAWDQEGWVVGRAAADLANLSPAPEVTA